MKKNVLIINIGWEQERLVEVLSEYEVNIYAINASEKWNKELPVKNVVQIDYRDLPSILRYAQEVRPVAVVADQCDYSYFASAIVSEKLGLPGPSLAAAQKTTNKWIQRECLKNTAVPQPAYRLCRFYSEVEAAADEIGYPVVVKPIDNRGSFGVNRVNQHGELRLAYQTALANAHSRMVLVEDFIHGVHITVDGYNFPRSGHRSLALASKTMLGGDKQVAMEIVYPGDIPASHYQNSMNVNAMVVRELGLSFGMTHAEYMIDDAGTPYLIEIANRGGGVLTSSVIVPEVSGVDVTRQLVVDALGLNQELQLPTSPCDASACLSFFRFEPGLLSRVEGVERVFGDSQVLAFKLMAKLGDTITSIDSDGSRHGFVITRGRTPSDARAAVQRVKASVRPIYS